MLDKQSINVYQDFEKDIWDMLEKEKEMFKKYNEITLIFPSDTHHPIEIIDGVKAFCLDQNKNFRMVSEIDEIVPAMGIAYITLTENDLATVIKNIRNTKFVLGADVGILSFNETVLKELLGITVVSTNFSAMGSIAAEMILSKNQGQIRNEFSIIKRDSL